MNSEKIKAIHKAIKNRKVGRLWSWIDIIWWRLFYGVSPAGYFGYDFDQKHYGQKTAYTCLQKRLEKQWNSSKNSIFFLDKEKFDNRFSEYLKRDWIYPAKTTEEEFRAFVRRHPSFIAKANWMCEGVGTEKCIANPDDEESMGKLYNRLKSEYKVCEELIVQHPKMAEFNPSSVNTLRIATLVQDNKPEIIAAAFRCGAGKGCVDNLHSGGICCGIDLDTGRIKSDGYNEKFEKHTVHPLSRIAIKGFEVPYWKEACKLVLETAMVFPDVKWIGWDVAITEVGPVIVEGNTNQGLALIQYGNTGLLDTFRKKGIVLKR